MLNTQHEKERQRDQLEKPWLSEEHHIELAAWHTEAEGTVGLSETEWPVRKRGSHSASLCLTVH